MNFTINYNTHNKGDKQMKIEEAYSLDHEDVIDAEKAYELYWEEIIQDKRNFQCPDPDCDAQITCAGLELSREEMKKIPHFRLYGKHNNECSLNENIQDQHKDRPVSTEENLMKYINNEVDIFLLDRPQDHSTTAVTKCSKKDIDHKKNKKRIKEESSSGLKRIPKYSTIKPLITKYEKYQREETLGNHYIHIKGYNVSYKEMFINVSNTKFESMSKYKRVYFGEAKIYAPTGRNYYIIRFKDSITKGQKEYYPSIYISEKLINEHYMNRKWRKTLDMLKDSLDSEKLIFFVYSKPTYKKKETENKTNEYIDFSIASLDYIDYRFDVE